MNDNKNTIGVNLPGLYSTTVFRRQKFIYAMHDSVTNYINAEGHKSRKLTELIQGFEECHIDLKKKGFFARLVKLDNEISKEMVKLIEEDKRLDYQVAALGIIVSC